MPHVLILYSIVTSRQVDGMIFERGRYVFVPFLFPFLSIHPLG
jgi:hypothetical protein